MKKKEQQKFSYAVGRPWDPEDPKSSICIYAYHSEVHFGTMEEAKQFRTYVNEQTARDHKTEKKSGKPPKYRIYQLIEIPDSE
jgi:hypothetical protein